MTTPPPPGNKTESISLHESEFFEVYECLHTLISEELLTDYDKLEGSNLISKCLDKLHLESDEKKKYDFRKGFLPLYNRMHQALNKSKKAEKIYSIQLI